MILDPLFACPLGARVAPDRLVAQAMEACDGTPDGGVSERTMARYAWLARGGWGVVFVEATSVTPTSLGRLRGLVLTHRTAESFRGLVGRFRELDSEGLLLIQLTHSGPQSHPWSDRSTVSLDPPSDMRSLSTEEIEGIRGQFVEAALLAEEVGFDGIDYKLCHGYLGTELLRPANTRGDRWGGSFENRMRFLVEGVEEIKARRRRSQFVLGGLDQIGGGRFPGGCDGAVIAFGSDMVHLRKRSNRLDPMLAECRPEAKGVGYHFTDGAYGQVTSTTSH